VQAATCKRARTGQDADTLQIPVQLTWSGVPIPIAIPNSKNQSTIALLKSVCMHGPVHGVSYKWS
jgi:hypothetical protein